MKDLVRPVVWLAAVFLLASCTSVSSRRAVPDPNKNNGLVYSLPNRMINLRVEFSETGEHKLMLTGGSYYPDSADTSRYVARIHKGKVGKIKATLVTSGGLLASADAKYTGQANELAQAIGSGLGFARGWSGDRTLPLVDVSPCKRKLTVIHSLPLSRFRKGQSFNVLGGNAPCANVSLDIGRIGTSSSGNSPAGNRANGLWYRVELPYTVTATLGDSIVATALVMLPDESPTYFVEMEAGIFADAENKMVFTHGILTSYEKSNDSEVISLFKLPAGIIAAYAKAVGDVFTNFSTAEKHEVNAEVAKLNRELLLRKLETCNLAISQDQPAETIKELCSIQPLP